MTKKRIPASVRLRTLLTEVENNGHVTVNEIAERMSVSEMTVRRDMDKLGAEGRLVRTHGGAHALDDVYRKLDEDHEPSVESRATQNQSEKKLIAKTALQYIHPRSTIAIDVGTTCFELAQLMKNKTVRVVSNSLLIQMALAKNQMLVYAPCGRIAGTDPSSVGIQTIEFIRNFNFEIAFIAVAGITENGLFDYSIEDAEIKKALVAQANLRVLLVDSSKIGASSAVKVMDFENIDILITDAPVSSEIQSILENSGIEVVVATQA